MTYKIRILLFLVGITQLSACAYMESVTRQAELLEDQETDPKQYNAKHIITQQTYIVYGQLKSTRKRPHSLAVVAVSNKYKSNEVVDINHLGKVGSYYALNLPDGTYQLLVLEDRNDDQIYSDTEVVAQRSINLQVKTYPTKLIGNIDFDLQELAQQFEHRLAIPVHTIKNAEPSVFFPKGTVRTLDDPIFSRQMATLGLYAPAAFMENSPMLFYSLEEDTPHKVPVIFVHGIGGTVTEFKDIIDKLDKDRYKPWFFYYPSGYDLEKLSRLFYDIYLSGQVVPKGPSKLVIVAHSMGGVVVREALNLYQGNAQETQTELFITLASPLGGLTSAQAGVEHAPLVIPAWYGLTPKGKIIHNLFRKPLSEPAEHHLVYGYLESGGPEDSDGIVPIQSQLSEMALKNSVKQYGFKSGHAEILRHPAAIQTVLNLLREVKTDFPDEHINYLLRGGFDVALNDNYSALEKRMIRQTGVYLRALAHGKLKPIYINRQFVEFAQGRSKPASYVDTAWQKFRDDYPALANDNHRGTQE